MGKLSRKDLPVLKDEKRGKYFYSLEEFETFLFGIENQKKGTNNKAPQMEILAGLEAFFPVLG